MDDHLETFLLSLLTVLLISLHGLCVAFGYALLKARGARIRDLADSGNITAIRVSHALERADEYLTAAKIGTIMVVLLLGWLSQSFFATRLLQPQIPALAASPHLALFLALLLMALVLLLFGGLLPQTLALRQPERTLLRLIYPIGIVAGLLFPCTWVLQRVVRGLVRMFGVTGDANKAPTEEELREFITASGEEHGGTLGETQAELLDNVMDFGRRMARQVMTHRTEILTLDIEASLIDNIRLAQEGGRTRYPVIAGDIDTVIGFVHTKDLFALYQRNSQGDMRDILRDILLVPETIRGHQLLRRMQRDRQHMAVLVDEYGGTAGLVTVYDLLEELVGEWPDEFEPTETEWLTAVNAHTWTVDGRLPLTDLEEAIGRPLSCDDECDTVGGYTFWLFGRIPEVEDTAEEDGIVLRVTEMDARRVSRVELTRIESSDESEHGMINGR